MIGCPMTIGTVQAAASKPISGANSQRPISGLPWGGFRDPVVAQAIENVTGRHQAEDFWAVSPHERTEAIYDEIKRLDLAKVRVSMETVADSLPPKGTQSGVSGSMDART